MISFKDFINTLTEAIGEYKNSPTYRDNDYKISKYDTDFYDKKLTAGYYRNEKTNKPFAYFHELIPKKEIIDSAADIIPKSDDIIHRGMSHAEYQNILKTGKIESKGSGNIGEDQKGLTYFTSDPRSADMYSNSFAMKRNVPDFENPAYIVSIKKPEASRIKNVSGTGENEIGVIGSIPKEDIVAVHKGTVVNYHPEVSRYSIDPWSTQKITKVFNRSPIAKVHWEKIL